MRRDDPPDAESCPWTTPLINKRQQRAQTVRARAHTRITPNERLAATRKSSLSFPFYALVAVVTSRPVLALPPEII